MILGLTFTILLHMRFVLKKTSMNLAILSVISIGILTGFILILGLQFEQSSTELRKDELKRLTTLGINSIDGYRSQYADGELSKDEALSLITDQVRLLIYEDKVQANYLFMSAYDGTMLVQPYERELEGSNQLNLTDADGRFIIRELISQARKEPGYVTYNYFPPGSDIPYKKISYVVGLPEFDCYIGTGIYSNDISMIKKFYFRQTAFFFIISFLILIAGGAIVAIPLFKAMRYIASSLLEIEKTPHLKNISLDSSRFRKGSDAEHIVQRFSEMSGNLSLKTKNLLDSYKERDRIMKNAVEEKELLIREMNHRLKNNLQIVISLLNLQKEKSDSSDVIESYNESISRMESISMIHQMLYQDKGSSEISGKHYLERLVQFLIRSFGMAEQIKLNLDIEEIAFSIEEAVNIGLLTNEVITNAVKYAAPGNPRCEITIRLSVSDGIHRMVLSDNGPGIPDSHLKEQSGLGLKLIQTLAAQLDAKLSINTNGGTLFELTF